MQFQTPVQHQLLLQDPEDEEQKGLEKMEVFDDSSGHESNLTSLNDEEKCLVVKETSDRHFKFGGGEVLKSLYVMEFPCLLNGLPSFI